MADIVADIPRAFANHYVFGPPRLSSSSSLTLA